MYKSPIRNTKLFEQWDVVNPNWAQDYQPLRSPPHLKHPTLYPPRPTPTVNAPVKPTISVFTKLAGIVLSSLFINDEAGAPDPTPQETCEMEGGTWIEDPEGEGEPGWNGECIYG